MSTAKKAPEQAPQQPQTLLDAPAASAGAAEATQQQQDAESAAAAAFTIRSTEEYAAAFDLEVWKAERMQEFQGELSQKLTAEREALERAFMAKDVERLEEVDRLRRELEGMAKRLNTTGKVLAKRITNQEKREEAFEARRLQHARESESVLHEIEVKHRRVLDEAYQKHENLSSQLRERDGVILHTNQRLTTLQQEYDALQRLVSRLQSQESSEKTTVAELRARCESLAGMVREGQTAIEERDRIIGLLQQERSELAAMCQTYKEKFSRLASEYNRVCEHMQAERERFFVQERERLTALARQQDLAAAKSAANTISATDVLSAQYLSIRNGATRGAVSPSNDEHVGEVEALKGIVAQLKRETEEDEAKRRKKEKKEKRHAAKRREEEEEQRRFPQEASHKSSSSLLVYAEPFPQQPSRNSVSPQRNVVSVGDVGQYLFEAEGHVIENGSGGGEARKSNRKSLHHPPQHHNSHQAPQQDDNVSVSTMSSPGVKSHALHDDDEDDGGRLQQTQQQHEGRDQTTAVQPQAVSSSAASLFLNASDDSINQYSYVSPFSSTDGGLEHVFYDAAQRGQHTNRRETDGDSSSAAYSFKYAHPLSASSSNDVAAPQTQNGIPTARMRDAFSAPPSVIEGDSLPDLKEFLNRLRSNRDKLLETGVYEPSDPLVLEMDRKIRTYETYLRAHYW